MRADLPNGQVYRLADPAAVHRDMAVDPAITRRTLAKTPAVQRAHADCPECEAAANSKGASTC